MYYNLRLKVLGYMYGKSGNCWDPGVGANEYLWLSFYSKMKT